MTRLSVTATPGPSHSFSPKSPASGKSGDQITALSVMGLPGGLQTFDPKTPAGEVVGGQITALSVMATPGGLHAFTAKAEAIVIEAPSKGGSGGYGDYQAIRSRILQEDDEILVIIMAHTLH